ncbi:hypothetical protein ASF22_02535 [Methylobacterium sp. Leaf87]|uniref:hypothetical protein n=1 Tax=Methylobacterium sp. Leaf87 TaxID=1736243 RepID=UPI0006F639D6|nr:hypothetical protein [Methylobacterium sp. Leaf87]KQO69505.1 hypothetical protein ASF22_02535 [Methylobacterium sp. Leaf87]
MKRYEVTDVFGTVHEINCDFMFNNGGEIVFRSGERGSTELVATFASGQWASCINVTKREKTGAAS